MKIRNPRVIRFAGWLGSMFARSLSATLRFKHREMGPPVIPLDRVPPGKRYIYALWHEYLLVPPCKFGHPQTAVLISKHADGQILEALIRSFGMGVVRGSTNRGGVEALRQVIDDRSGSLHLTVTPDGPRGPRRQAQPGMVYLASRAGMEIIPVGFGLDRPWRAKSWDRFAIPRPFTRARMIFGNPIPVDPEAKLSDLEPVRLQVEQEIEKLTLWAEQWAETGVFPAEETPASTPMKMVS